MTGPRKPYTPSFYEVPPDTRPTQCRGQNCKAEIYWIKNGEKRLPVDCDVDGGYEPTQHDAGRGVSHFTTCADVGRFSRSNRK